MSGSARRHPPARPGRGPGRPRAVLDVPPGARRDALGAVPRRPARPRRPSGYLDALAAEAVGAGRAGAVAHRSARGSSHLTVTYLERGCARGRSRRRRPYAGSPPLAAALAAGTPPLRWQVDRPGPGRPGRARAGRAGRRRPRTRSARRSCASSAELGRAEAVLPRLGLVGDPAALRRAGRRPGRRWSTGSTPAPRCRAGPGHCATGSRSSATSTTACAPCRCPSPRRRSPAYRRSPRCRARLTVRPRRRPCSGCGCTTPSAAGCGSPATATSSGPSSARCAGPRCRWPTRPASRRTPRSATPGAAPTGVASEAEYLEIGLAQRCDPERLRAALDASLPDDLDVLEMVEVAPPPPERQGGEPGRPAGGLGLGGPAARGRAGRPRRGAVAAFLAADRAEVTRMTKNGLRTFDARAAVVALEPPGPDPRAAWGAATEPCAILRLVVRHVTPAVRPDDVLAGLASIGASRRPRPPRSPGWRKAPSTSRPERCPTHWHRTGTPPAPCRAPSRPRGTMVHHQTSQDVRPRRGRTTTAPARRCATPARVLRDRRRLGEQYVPCSCRASFTSTYC